VCSGNRYRRYDDAQRSGTYEGFLHGVVSHCYLLSYGLLGGSHPARYRMRPTPMKATGESPLMSPPEVRAKLSSFGFS
jgi:hypothetical protein